MHIEDELRQKDGIGRMFGQTATLEGIALEHGRRFTPVPLPEGIELGEPKNCYSNSIAVVLGAPDEMNYRYCEGYAWRANYSLILIHHAWVTIEDTDVAIDTTLPEADKYEYWGIDFQTQYAVEVMEQYGRTGLTLEHYAKAVLKEAAE